jgi:hypothetical protein
MKKAKIIASGKAIDQTLEDRIQNRNKNVNELAIKNAIHHSVENRPHPEKDMLEAFTGELRTSYEMEASEIYHYVQPHSYFEEAQIEEISLKEKENNLALLTQEKLGQIKNLKYANDKKEEGSVIKRIWFTLLITFIINLGEIIYNSKSFQVTGESFLFSLFLSVIVSFSVFIFSHLVPFLYKIAKTTLQRRLLIWGSLAFASLVFWVMAILRTDYLANHDVHLSPLIFTLFNLFFFVVSSLVSFFMLPTWAELKEQTSRSKILKEIEILEKEVKQIQIERQKIDEERQENLKDCSRMKSYYNSLMDRLRKMYFETIELYKATNRTYRKDGIIPVCFSDVLPQPDIKDISFTNFNY